MTIRQTRLVLWATAAILAAGAAAVAVLAAMAPYPMEAAGKPGPAAGQAARGADTGLPPLSAFEKVWGQPLRRPLVDPPPPPPAVVQKPPLPLHLTGTAADEPGASCGFFQVQGRLVMAGPGETIGVPGGKVEVVRIGAAEAVVRWCGEEITLKPQGQEKRE